MQKKGIGEAGGCLQKQKSRQLKRRLTTLVKSDCQDGANLGRLAEALYLEKEIRQMANEGIYKGSQVSFVFGI